MDVRRVITGHDDDGNAVFVDDAAVVPLEPRLLPGFAWHWVWGVDQAPQLEDDGSSSGGKAFYPPVDGLRFGLLTLPPDTTGVPDDVDVAEASAELAALMPGMAEHMDADDPGMHRTATCDFIVVLSGEVTLELDNGAAVQLTPGDTIVQNGTSHRWSNRGSTPTTMAIVLCGSRVDGGR